LARAEQHVSDLERQHEEATRALSSAKSQIEHSREEKRTVTAVAEERERDVRAAQEALRNINEQYQRTSAELSALQSRSHEVETQLIDEKLRATRLEQEKSLLEQHSAWIGGELARVQAQLAQTQQQR